MALGKWQFLRKEKARTCIKIHSDMENTLKNDELFDCMAQRKHFYCKDMCLVPHMHVAGNPL